MKEKAEIITRVSEFVFALFKEHLSDSLVYHTYQHTELVADTARKIAEGMKLGKEGIEVVTLAGWFHDTGYTEIHRGHEEVSIRIAKQFLKKDNYPEEKIELIAGCIRATKIPQQPKNLLEEILADADLSGLGRKSFFEQSRLLRIELERAIGVTYTEEQWTQQNLDLLTSHKYFTSFAQDAFDNQQSENIRILSKELLKNQ